MPWDDLTLKVWLISSLVGNKQSQIQNINLRFFSDLDKINKRRHPHNFAQKKIRSLGNLQNLKHLPLFIRKWLLLPYSNHRIAHTNSIQTVFFPVFPQITNHPSPNPIIGLHPTTPWNQVSWRPSYSGSLFLNYLSKNILFLVQHLILSRLSIKEKGATEMKQDPVGLSYLQKPFHVHHFMFVREKFQLPRPSLGFKGQIQLLIRVRECRD